VNPLLAEPTDEQARLLDVVYRGREEAGCPHFLRADAQGQMHKVGKPGDWPIFQYVESILYREHGLDARSVLLECPSVRFNGGQARYGWIDLDKPNANMLGSGDKVRLNIAGVARVPRAATEVEVFLDVLSLLVNVDRSIPPSATSVQNVQLNAAELQRRLGPPEGHWSLSPAGLASIRAMLEREPSTWNCQLDAQEESGNWTATLSPFIRGYAGVSTPDEYVERLVQLLVPPSPVSAPLYPSSLSLPEAIDYLNAVWRVHAGKPLLRIARAEAAAKLALDCANADELDARLSAFCGILGDLQLPESQGNKKLTDLKDYLAQKLVAETVGRAETAVDDLRAFLDIRAWRQHPGGRANEQGRKGMQRLGVELPTSDWQGAWQHLQAQAVAALSVLREEIDALG
jgi:hypothetical protein